MCGGGLVDAERMGGWWAHGDDPRAEFNADGDVVMGREAAFAEADCQLVRVSEVLVPWGGRDDVRLISRSPSPPATRSWLCNPMAETWRSVKPLHTVRRARRGVQLARYRSGGGTTAWTAAGKGGGGQEARV